MTDTRCHIKFVIGSRQIFSVPRKVTTISFGLDQLVGNAPVSFPAPDDGGSEASQGYRILSAPTDGHSALIRQFPDHIIGGFQSYNRYYIDMAGSYDDYLARFSSKTRSTFNRKRRKLGEHCGGKLDIREYRSAFEMVAFLDHALPLSNRTYQSRLLDAGLPESESARTEMLELANSDLVRAYLLFADDQAISYLYLPITDGIVSYAFLGYDPEFAHLSAGTVLQLEALERLFAEQKYRYFDFTEGEGGHKQMFGTDCVAACSFFLLKSRPFNWMLLRGLDGFDRSVMSAKQMATRSGINANIRRLLRS